MLHSVVNRMAAEFWRLVGKYETFPRSLESSVAWALPLAIVKLPHLGLKEICNWLGEKGISVNFHSPDRLLRACLIAQSGRGIIFLDGSDPEDERRFSLAHEIAHFLKDYLYPRKSILSLFGEDLRDVLDGYRRPTPEERLKGVFRGVSLGTYTNLMERSPKGDVEKAQILDSEDFADQLALELLAPRDEVSKRLEAQGICWRKESAFQMASQTLIQQFGLTPVIAERYGAIIVLEHRQAKSFREWLGVQI